MFFLILHQIYGGGEKYLWLFYRVSVDKFILIISQPDKNYLYRLTYYDDDQLWILIKYANHLAYSLLLSNFKCVSYLSTVCIRILKMEERMFAKTLNVIFSLEEEIYLYVFILPSVHKKTHNLMYLLHVYIKVPFWRVSTAMNETWPLWACKVGPK